MVTTILWDEVPVGFTNIIWRGNGSNVVDVPAIINTDTKVSVLQLQLDDNDRRCLIEGNPLFLIVGGGLPPFALTASLADALNLARGE